MSRIAIAALVASMYMASAVQAAGQAAQPGAKSQWEVNWAEQRCSIARTAGRSGITLVLRTHLSEQNAELIFRDVAWRGDPLDGARKVDVTLEPAGVRIEAEAVAQRRPDGSHLLSLKKLGRQFFDQFAAAKHIRVEREGKAIAEVAIPGAVRAVEAFRVCRDDLVASWGFDPAVLAGLQKWPAPIQAFTSLFRAEDYPGGRAWMGDGGVVTVRYTVGVDGRVSECAPISDPGKETPFYKRTCQILIERGRFEPAIAADGRAIATPNVLTMNWYWPPID